MHNKHMHPSHLGNTHVRYRSHDRYGIIISIQQSLTAQDYARILEGIEIIQYVLYLPIIGLFLPSLSSILFH